MKQATPESQQENTENLRVEPQAGEHQRTAFRRYADLLGKYLLPLWPRASLMAVLLLGGIALQLIVPQILRQFIDAASEGQDTAFLIRLAAIFLTIAIFQQVLSACATYISSDVGWRATNNIRNDLAQHCLRLDMAFHNARTAGELIERIDGDVTALSNFFSQFTVRIFGSIIMLISILVLLWIEQPIVGITLTAFCIIAFFTLGRIREWAVPATKMEREASAQLYSFIEERLSGMDDLRANGAGRFTLRQFQTASSKYFFRQRTAWRMRMTIWISSYGLFVIADFATLALAVWLYSRGSITLGTGYLLFQYMLMLEGPIEQLSQQMQDLQKATAGIGRIDELFQIEQHVIDGNEVTAVASGALGVKFDNVSFAYEEKPVLSNLSFELKAGQKLGLLGRTGSGKSTLSRLLFRFYDSTGGQVILGNKDIRDLQLADVRQRVGMVTQEVQLFDATVRENLSFFDTTIPDKQIIAVIHDLGLGEWFDVLELGLDSKIETGGGNLSAGQAQLLAFARVFLKNPGLVILDEPSSRLDPVSEELLERAIDKLLQGRTAIIIAHRLETVKRADDIMMLADGELLEYGVRRKLEQDTTSHYHKLVNNHTGESLDTDWDIDNEAIDLKEDFTQPQKELELS